MDILRNKEKIRLFLVLLSLFLLVSCEVCSDINQNPSPKPTESIKPTSSPDNRGVAPSIARINIFGFVYDNNKNPIDNATVTIKFLDNNSKTEQLSYKEYKTDLYGLYLFRGLPDKEKIEISVFKEGYKMVKRIEETDLNPDKQPYGYGYSGNMFNFGGDGEDAKYALEKE